MKFPKLLILILFPLSIAAFLDRFHYGAYFAHGSLVYFLYNGYFTDLVQPFGLYFVLCLSEPWLAWMRPWWTKVLIVFLLPSAMEILQGLGWNVFGRGFDRFDFLAYALGGLFAAFVERKALARLAFWSLTPPHAGFGQDHVSSKNT